MKKKLLYVLSLSLIGVLASCTNNPENSSGNQTNSENSSQQSSVQTSTTTPDITQEDLEKGKTTHTHRNRHKAREGLGQQKRFQFSQNNRPAGQPDR